MKKNKQTRLVVAREVLRVLQEHQHRLARGGNGDAETQRRCPPPLPTGDSVRICCA